jgi:hypothetical protein
MHNDISCPRDTIIYTRDKIVNAWRYLMSQRQNSRHIYIYMLRSNPFREAMHMKDANERMCFPWSSHAKFAHQAHTFTSQRAISYSLYCEMQTQRQRQRTTTYPCPCPCPCLCQWSLASSLEARDQHSSPYETPH